MITDTEVHTDVTWTPEAWDQRAEMMKRVSIIEMSYGSAAGNHAYANIAQCFLHLLSMGPTKVYKDHDGLLFVSPYITIGMVWFPDSDQKMAARIGWPADEIRPDWPRTGEWSLHS